MSSTVRSSAEQTLLAKTYPGFKLHFEGGALRFRGQLSSNYRSAFLIDVVLPPRFPEEEPKLWVLSPTLPPGTAYRYSDGSICAHASRFVPYKTSVATMISVMAGWLFRFDRHRLQGISWEEPIEPAGQPLGVNPDGTLFVRSRA